MRLCLRRSSLVGLLGAVVGLCRGSLMLHVNVDIVDIVTGHGRRGRVLIPLSGLCVARVHVGV